MTDIKPIKVNGVAVREGISRNRIKYTAEALSKFSSTLANKPILKDHDARVDNTIGLVTQSHTVDGGKSVRYEGWVKEDGTNVIERIKDGAGACIPLRVTRRAGKKLISPCLLVKCGCCDQSLEIYYDEKRTGNQHRDSLEINGVNGTVDQWRQVLFPFLKTRR